jgi:hypothetical protein
VGQGSCFTIPEWERGYLPFSVHAKEENVTVLQCAGVEVEFIPAGYTAVLQVMVKRVTQDIQALLPLNCIN